MGVPESRAPTGPAAAIDETPFAAPVPGRARRRSAALTGLSHEHHHALAQALVLKRLDEADAAAAWERFLVFWEEEGSDHFAEEEGVLLPAFARAGGDATDPAVVRTLLEHVLIRAKVDEIRAQAEPRASDLHLLGDWLELHVRLEERILFPLIEDTVPEASLRALGEALE